MASQTNPAFSTASEGANTANPITEPSAPVSDHDTHGRNVTSAEDDVAAGGGTSTGGAMGASAGDQLSWAARHKAPTTKDVERNIWTGAAPGSMKHGKGGVHGGGVVPEGFDVEQAKEERANQMGTTTSGSGGPGVEGEPFAGEGITASGAGLGTAATGGATGDTPYDDVREHRRNLYGDPEGVTAAGGDIGTGFHGAGGATTATGGEGIGHEHATVGRDTVEYGSGTRGQDTSGYGTTGYGTTGYGTAGSGTTGHPITTTTNTTGQDTTSYGTTATGGTEYGTTGAGTGGYHTVQHGLRGVELRRGDVVPEQSSGAAFATAQATGHHHFTDEGVAGAGTGATREGEVEREGYNIDRGIDRGHTGDEKGEDDDNEGGGKKGILKKVVDAVKHI